MKIRTFAFLLLFTMMSCDGTLADFKIISFPTSKKKLEIAIDSLYSNYPEYRMPEKWKEHDSWSKRGYDFLESRIFYFKNEPEEMYYVTFVGEEETLKDTTHIDIAISSVYRRRTGNWNEEDFDKEEKIRIQTRFKREIISKLEKYTKTKAKEEN
ncbi:hypothetical protein [Flavobacterium aquicola]|uniref:Uncharacterized protein n=1 Tax=Flavobacterium aquicola TaxID=1682742 RepID=A0A3E0ETN8_9FLAO|nr:hypothetical protein [Flavobacterium aquicola]REH00760.1 hypothetical protein C8P67_1024 [Flavobacterium aquicola]